MCIVIQRDVMCRRYAQSDYCDILKELLSWPRGWKSRVLQVKCNQGAGRTFQAKEQLVARAEDEIMVLEGPVSSSICW